MSLCGISTSSTLNTNHPAGGARWLQHGRARAKLSWWIGQTVPICFNAAAFSNICMVWEAEKQKELKKWTRNRIYDGSISHKYASSMKFNQSADDTALHHCINWWGSRRTQTKWWHATLVRRTLNLGETYKYYGTPIRCDSNHIVLFSDSCGNSGKAR